MAFVFFIFYLIFFMLLSFARKRWSRVSGEDDLDFFFLFLFLLFPAQLPAPASTSFGMLWRWNGAC